MTPSLGAEDVHVWTVPATTADADARAVLSPEERASADRFVFEADRVRYTASHAALRRLLGAYLGREPVSLRFQAGERGKPRLVGEERRFNLSHSGELAAIAVARVEVGVDVERVREVGEELAARCFAPEELAWLATRRGEREAFFRLWTLKEAFLKADGSGLAWPLREVMVRPAGPERVSSITARGEEWAGTEIEAPAGYRLAVCTRRPAAVYSWTWPTNASGSLSPTGGVPTT